MILDLSIIALFWFAALAYGSNELWAMGAISLAAIVLFTIQILWQSWRGKLQIAYGLFYVPLIAVLMLCGIQAVRYQKILGESTSRLPFTVSRYDTLLYLLLAVSYVVIIQMVHCGFRSRKSIKILLGSILLLGFFEAVFGLVQHLADYDYIWSFKKTSYLGVATGTLINHNHYALLMNLIISMGLGYLFYRSQDLLIGVRPSFRNVITAPGVSKIAWIILLLALMGLGVVFSMSRMGIAAMLCSIGVIAIAGSILESGQLVKVLSFILIFAILGLAFYTGIDAVIARYESLSLDSELEQHRIAIWRDAWKMIKTNPLWGQGLGTFQWTFPAFETVDPDIPAKYAHNDYLQLIAEIGIVGLGLLLWAFGLAWLRAVQTFRHSEDALARGIALGTMGALTAIGLQELTDFGLYIPGVAVLVSLILGLNLRAAQIDTKMTIGEMRKRA